MRRVQAKAAMVAEARADAAAPLPPALDGAAAAAGAKPTTQQRLGLH